MSTDSYHMSTDSYHISNFGSFASPNLRPDLDGYVYLTTAAVIDGVWEAMVEMDEDYAAEIAAQNRAATRESEEDIAEWRARNT